MSGHWQADEEMGVQRGEAPVPVLSLPKDRESDIFAVCLAGGPARVWFRTQYVERTRSDNPEADFMAKSGIPPDHKWVISFQEGNGVGRGLLGSKGAELAEMSSMGLPVPPRFTITTEAWREYDLANCTFPEGLWEMVRAAFRSVRTIIVVKDRSVFGRPQFDMGNVG